MRALMQAVAILLLLATFAGCFAKPRADYAGIESKLDAHAAQYLGTGADDVSALGNASYNMQLVGYSNGVDDSGDANKIPGDGYYTELAVTSKYAYLSRNSASGAYGGFAILDLTNKSAPHKVGDYKALGSADIEVNDNESLAFLATQRNLPPQMAQSALTAQDPRAGAPRGIYVVDISEKNNPRFASFVPLPVNGPHTLTYYHHPNGKEFVIACTYDLVTDPSNGALVGTVSPTQRVIVFQVQPAVALPGGLGKTPATLTPVSQFTLPDQAPVGKLFLPHDTRVQVHPSYSGGDKVLLYVAYWDRGLRILDFSDPMNLKEIGFTTDFAPSSLNNIHLAQPFDGLIAGKHVTVTQPEIPAVQGETGQITFFDTSDPTSPQKLGHWTLPKGDEGQLSISNFDYSPHNFDLWDGHVALAHFHAGVWVIDVHDAQNLAAPKSVGFYMPHVPRTGAPSPQPNTWGVYEVDGLLYAVDESTGLYVLHYTGP